MFAIKTIIDEEMLERVREAKSPKKVWDTLKALSSWKNDMGQQAFKNVLLSI